VAKLKSENDELKGELNCFDPAFFDEIEDLKYNHNEMVRVYVWVGVCVQKLPFVVRLKTSSTTTTMKWCRPVGWWVFWYNRNAMLRICEWVGVLVPSQRKGSCV